MSDMERFVLGLVSGGLFVLLMAVAAVLVSAPRRSAFVAGLFLMACACLSGIIFASVIT